VLGVAQAQGNFVYTNNDINQGFGQPFPPNTVSAFALAPDGALTQITGSPFQTGGTGSGFGPFAAPRAIIRTAGPFLYVSNSGSSDISGFLINPSTGGLTPVPGSPFPILGGGVHTGISLAMTPDGRFLIAGNTGTGVITVFSIGGDGALSVSANSPVFFSGLVGMKVAPNGAFLAVASITSDMVAMFSIGTDGTLTPVPGSPFTSPGIGSSAGVEFNCASTLLFVGEANNTGTSVSVFAVASNGALVAGSPFFTAGPGVNSNATLLSSDERFLFVSNQFTGSITVLAATSGGSLSQIAGSPFPLSGGVTAFNTPCSMVTNSLGTLLFSANSSAPSSVNVLRVGLNGILTEVASSPFPIGQDGTLTSLAVFPTRACLGPSPFTVCIQDDLTGSQIRVNATTGDYLFNYCPKGITASGRGVVTNSFCKTEIRDGGVKNSGRNVAVSINVCTGVANATIQLPGQSSVFRISDSNINNNSCNCR
jgi:6-phosphogluconolactonase (cycloisomerase 2 family)